MGSPKGEMQTSAHRAPEVMLFKPGGSFRSHRLRVLFFGLSGFYRSSTTAMPAARPSTDVPHVELAGLFCKGRGTPRDMFQ